MTNPWLKKNPFLSFWLSSANKAIGTARGHATGAARRSAASMQADFTRQVTEFWFGKPAAKRTTKRRRR